MSASERDVPQQPRVMPGHGDMSGIAASGLSMRDLLASCAAASAVSTPPADEVGDGETEGAGACAGEGRRDAA
ncbi:hypothetical protein ACWGDS_16045 [Streptomyces sp. NPDC055059]|jgi:hypothetical protein|uniref:Uncharacterized protein n=1 Tax=Streptomyces sp. NBC_00119 TaxID=2975659 RepID=A0AAU1UPH4_9ACTN|nr:MULTISPECIES: hypothetical protein [unclassified Streptomyces]MCX4643735.1 hypothetical protein [Streptomyces sp. NBC_01446]MCX5324845.1 hypothetical protein [Streptomyces sp. NBC_00120]